jgi:transposase
VPMRAPPPVALSHRERAELLHWTRGRSVPVRQAERARIVLLAADGLRNLEIGEFLHLSPVTVRRWRARFALLGMAGISGDAPRSGHRKGSATVAAILERTRSGRPTNGVRWTTRSLAREIGVSHTTIRRVWRNSGIQPPRQRRWRLSPDPRFLDRRIDVAGIYVDPPSTILALTVERPKKRRGLRGEAPDLPGAGTVNLRPTALHSSGGSQQLAETVGPLDGLPPSTASWRLTYRELLLFLESVNDRSGPMSEIHLLTGGGTHSRDDRVLHWIERHPRFHLFPPEAGQPISSVVRGWFEPRRTSRGETAGIPHLPQLQRWLGSYLDGVAMFGRPFAWTRAGAVSHWRAAPTETFLSSTRKSPRFSARSRSPSV